MKINKLILGTVQLGLDYGINNSKGKPSLEMAFKMLNTAWDNGIKILDTAEAYGNAQEVIGKFHKAFSEKTFKIITKIDARLSLQKGELIQHIKQNLIELNLDVIHGYMFHNYKSFKENNHLYTELKQAKSLGLINKLGVSLHSNEELKDVIENYEAFNLVQLPFNLFDNHSKRSVLLQAAKSKGIEIHTRSVFLQGLFFKSPKDLKNKVAGFSENLKNLNILKQKNNLKTEVLCLQYVLQKEYIDHVLIGVDNDEQLLKNIEISKVKMDIPTPEIDTINIKNTDLLNPANWH